MTVPALSTVLPTLQRPVAETRGRTNARTSDDTHAGSSRTQRDQGRSKVEETDRDTSDGNEAAGSTGQDFLATLEAALGTATLPVAAPATPAAPPTTGAGDTTVATALPGSTRGPLFTMLPGSTIAPGALTGQAGLPPTSPGQALPAGTTAPESPTSSTAPATQVATAAVPATATQASAGAPEAAPTTTPAPTSTIAPATADGQGAGRSDADASQSGQSGQSGRPGTAIPTTAQSLPNDDSARTESTVPGPAAASAAAPTAAAPTTTIPTATPAKPPTATEAMTRQVFPEITRFTQTATPGTHRLAITLHPEDLGEVKVTMIVRAGTLQVRLSAETPAARAALASGTSELHRMLELASTAETRVMVRDTSGASTDTRTGSGSSDANAGQNTANAQTGQNSGNRNPTPESAEEWAQGWAGGGVETPAPTLKKTPEQVPTGPAATTNPGRLDRLM